MSGRSSVCCAARTVAAIATAPPRMATRPVSIGRTIRRRRCSSRATVVRPRRCPAAVVMRRSGVVEEARLVVRVKEEVVRRRQTVQRERQRQERVIMAHRLVARERAAIQKAPPTCLVPREDRGRVMVDLTIAPLEPERAVEQMEPVHPPTPLPGAMDRVEEHREPPHPVDNRLQAAMEQDRPARARHKTTTHPHHPPRPPLPPPLNRPSIRASGKSKRTKTNPPPLRRPERRPVAMRPALAAIPVPLPPVQRVPPLPHPPPPPPPPGRVQRRARTRRKRAKKRPTSIRTISRSRTATRCI